MVNTERIFSTLPRWRNYNILNIVVNTELANPNNIINFNYNILNIVVNTELVEWHYPRVENYNILNIVVNTELPTASSSNPVRL